MLPECMYFDGIGLPEGKAWDPLRSLEPIRIVPKNGLFEFAMRFAEQKVASKDEGESGQAY